MGQTARLRLTRDRFIAGHSSCELRRYLDSVPPETHIRDVVDRCRVWESHADPEIRRVSKPTPDPIYPTYVVGDSDHVGEALRVAAVTKLKSPPDQLEDLLRRLLANMAAPVPKIVALSGGGDIESPADGCDSTRARGVGKLVQIVPLGTADIGTADSAETHQKRLEWRRMFCMQKVGSCCDSLPRSG